MGIERLQRVMWRLRKRNPGEVIVSIRELERAIMYECGTSRQTYKDNKRALRKLGWIRAHGKIAVKLTGVDLIGEE